MITVAIVVLIYVAACLAVEFFGGLTDDNLDAPTPPDTGGVEYVASVLTYPLAIAFAATYATAWLISRPVWAWSARRRLERFARSGRR